MSASKKKREFNRAKVEHNIARLKAEGAAVNLSIVTSIPSLMLKENEWLHAQLSSTRELLKRAIHSSSWTDWELHDDIEAFLKREQS